MLGSGVSSLPVGAVCVNPSGEFKGWELLALLDSRSFQMEKADHLRLSCL